MGDPHVKERFFIVFHNPLTEISNLALLAKSTFISKLFLLIGKSVGSV